MQPTRKLTKTQNEVLAAMLTAVNVGTWTDISRPMVGITIRHTVTEPTPEYVSKAQWSGETYSSHCFLTFVANKILMRDAPAPWVASQDTEIPYWLALEILKDPSLGHDSHRRLELRSARRRRAPGEGLRQADEVRS